MAIELGTAYVSVAASTKGVVSQVSKDFGDAGKRAGSVFGRQFDGGARAAVSSADQTRAALRRVQSQVDAGAESVKRARKAEEDAARQARIAEAKLAEVRQPRKSAALEKAEKALADLRKSGAASTEDLEKAEKAVAKERAAAGPKNSAVLAAEDRLAKARDKQQLAAVKVKAAEADLSTNRRKLAQTSKQLEQAEQSADKGAERRLKGRWAKLFPSRDVSGAAKKVGAAAGKSLAEGVEAEAKTGLKQRLGGLLSGAKKGGGGLLKGLGLGAVGAVGGVVGGAVAGAVGLGGVALTKGFERLDSIDKARAKLKGLGHDTATTQTILDNALNSVRGTAFGMGEAATLAGQITAAGIKPGKDLERTLKLVGDTATIAGSDLGDMGSIFSKVAGVGKLTGESMAQLSERGIPVLQWLSKEYKVSTEEAQKMVSDGKVKFADFQRVIEKNIGGAAASSGDTFSGAMDNAKAALGRLGASFLEPLFGEGAGVFKGLTEQIDKLAPAAKEAGKQVKDLIDDVGGVLSILFAGEFKGAGKTFGLEEDSPVVSTLFGIRDAAKDVQGVLSILFKGDFAGADKTFGLEEDSAGVGLLFDIRDTAKNVVGWIRREAVPRVKELFSALKDGFSTGRRIVTEFARGMWERIKPLWPQVKEIFEQVGGIIADVLEMAKRNVRIVTAGIQDIWDRWGNQIMGTVKWVFNLVLGIVKAALKIVRGIIQTATGLMSGDWSKVWDGIKLVFSGVWDGIKRIFSSAWDGIKGIWETSSSWVTRKWSEMWDSVKATGKQLLDDITGLIEKWGLDKAFSTVVSAIGTAWDKIKSTLARPVDWVIDVVLNKGIIAAFNKIAETFKVDLKIADLPLLSKPSSAPSALGGGGGRQLAMASGGIIPGYTPGRDVHEFFSPTGGRLSLSGGEPVMRPEFGRLVGGERGVAMLNSAARRGRGALLAAFDALGHQALATGGMVSLRGHRFTQEFAKRLLMAEQMVGGAMSITQGGWRPATSYSGTSHAGDAVDIVGRYHQFIKPLRMVGIPTWDRAGKGNWIAHAHGVPLPGAGTAGGSAVWQAQDYLRGGDGLGGRDNGPRVGAVGSLDFGSVGGLLKVVGDGVKSLVLDLAGVFSPSLRRLDDLPAGAMGRVAGGFARRTAGVMAEGGQKLLGFQGGGVSRGGGWAALSEDGRPEMVVGPQLQRLMSGSRVYSYDETRRMFGGDIYVQNPFTGEWLLAEMVSVADGVVTDHSDAEKRRKAFA